VLYLQGLQAARQLALAEGREPPEEQPPKFTDHHIGFDALLVAQVSYSKATCIQMPPQIGFLLACLQSTP
jgi:hypothetical protein